MRIGAALLVVLVAGAGPLSAAPPGVQLRIEDGQVWLTARDATISQILAEWTRVGQTAIANADRLPVGRLTLELSGIPEREALDLLLRGASGFVATTRVQAAPGLIAGPRSQFERILIVATSRPAAPVALETRAAGVAMPAEAPVHVDPTPIAPGVRRLVGADGKPVPDDQEGAPTQAPQQPPTSMPPGFAEPPQAAAAPTAPATTTSSPTPRAPAGVPVPGIVVVTPPRQPGQPPR